MSQTPPLREWQLTAVGKIFEAWKVPDSKPLIAACPGAGKTLLTAHSATELLKSGQIELLIVLCPTVNIKQQWAEEFEKFGLKVSDQVTNATLRRRQQVSDEHETGGHQVLCLTYAMAAKDYGLYVELARRFKTLVVADEVHHADDDESFGKALSAIAYQASFRLALSGTPFNTKGGSLAMCESIAGVDDDGRPTRTATPIYTYSYGDAINAGVCRPAEFVYVLGKTEVVRKSLADDKLFKKTIDLALAKRTDSLSPLLDADGEYIGTMLHEGLQALRDLHHGESAIDGSRDTRAGMLVVARDVKHGEQLAQLIQRMNDAGNYGFSIVEIYNDTPKAHERIKQLKFDRTDIIITVRMISEGVDIRRLRVGVFCSDYLTRMFLIQFLGRMARMEDRLGPGQFCKIILPGHILLLEYAREIEKMIAAALIAPIPGEGGNGPEPKTSFVSNTPVATGTGLMMRGNEESGRGPGEAFFNRYPEWRGRISEMEAAQFARDMHLEGFETAANRPKYEESWSTKNVNLVRALGRAKRKNGTTEGDREMYARINAAANKYIGVQKIDELTSDELLKKRHAFLVAWLNRLISGKEEADA